MEEMIFEELPDLPDDYVIDLAKALFLKGDKSLDAICGLIERMHHQMPERKEFFGAAFGLVSSLPEKTYDAFRARAKQEIENPEVPLRVQMFYQLF